MDNEYHSKSEMKRVEALKSEKLKTEVIIKLTMLIGACRTKSITKKQIEESMQRYIKELEEKW